MVSLIPFDFWFILFLQFVVKKEKNFVEDFSIFSISSLAQIE